ncbi:MAG: DsbA family protein [Anaerolineales bacterium]|nr:DsbA family protein [Anaerolineales bacterium]MDW8227352.1 thioredoxin domain-containing protein [Anaerolineales bacterium]
MSKRQELRDKRKRERFLNRLMVILFVALGALLIAFALIFPTINYVRQQAQKTVLPIETLASSTSVEVIKSGKTMGDPNAPVRIEVWEDFQCPGCVYYSTKIEPLLIEKYIATGKVYYTYNFFLILGNTPDSESFKAASASMCALEQERFWDYHDLLFLNWMGENVGAFSDERLILMAESLSLDMQAFKECYQSNKYASVILEETQKARQLGLTSTPTILINGRRAESSAGPQYIPSFEDLSRLIEAILAAGQ